MKASCPKPLQDGRGPQRRADTQGGGGTQRHPLPSRAAPPGAQGGRTAGGLQDCLRALGAARRFGTEGGRMKQRPGVPGKRKPASCRGAQDNRGPCFWGVHPHIRGPAFYRGRGRLLFPVRIGSPPSSRFLSPRPRRRFFRGGLRWRALLPYPCRDSPNARNIRVPENSPRGGRPSYPLRGKRRGQIGRASCRERV